MREQRAQGHAGGTASSPTAAGHGHADAVGTYPHLSRTPDVTGGLPALREPGLRERVCPVGATYKDPVDRRGASGLRQVHRLPHVHGGVPLQRACAVFNWEEPKYTIDFSVGSAEVPVHQKHVVEKCTMCWHRLAKGEEPACVEVCPGRARFWGDLDDPASEVSRLIRDREYQQLLAEEGTKPSVYYLV